MIPRNAGRNNTQALDCLGDFSWGLRLEEDCRGSLAAGNGRNDRASQPRVEETDGVGCFSACSGIDLLSTTAVSACSSGQANSSLVANQKPDGT